MDALELIFSRRSVRHFSNEAVSEEELDVLLRAAMQAPSADNGQPWHFVVIDDREILNAITRFHPFSKALMEAPLAILVCGDVRLESAPGRWVQDCSAATQNLLLAAHSMGLGAVWLGVQPEPDRIESLRDLVRLPSGVHPLALVAVGRPHGELPPSAERYRPERVHRNRWSE
ncbi:MAG: nitroreductase family protein [Chloroflexi bacterium]|nr:nitroreductase family protein [Chloroflexota bacterium]